MSLRDVDLSLGPQPDAESIVHSLLSEFVALPAFKGVRVESEVTPVTDSTIVDHPVILYQCGAPTLDEDTHAWLFRVPLSLTVLTWEDPLKAWNISSKLDMFIRTWPFHDATPFGMVNGIISDGGFSRQQIGGIVTSKGAIQYGADKVIMVSPRSLE